MSFTILVCAKQVPDTANISGEAMKPGLLATFRGKANVFVTHPKDRKIPCTLAKTIDVPVIAQLRSGEKPRKELRRAGVQTVQRSSIAGGVTNMKTLLAITVLCMICPPVGLRAETRGK